MTPQNTTEKSLLPICAGEKPKKIASKNKNTITALAKMSEAKLQGECYQWACNTYPQIRGLFFSVPNGGKRGMREAAALRATGVTAGIPDMILIKILPFQKNPTVYGFEFKRPKEKMSEAQEKIHVKWKAERITMYLIFDVDFFKAIIKFLLD